MTLPALRPDLFGRFLVALGLLRVADERGPEVQLGWPNPFQPAHLEGDLDELAESIVADARETLATLDQADLRDHSLWLLAGQQRMSTTLAAAIPLITVERVREDLLTEGTPHPDVATLRWDPTRIAPGALRASQRAGAGSRGVPTQEYLAWRALGGTAWTSLYQEEPSERALWPVWAERLTPLQAIPFVSAGRSTWMGRAVIWSAAIRLGESGYHREVAPGRPFAT